MKPSSSFEASVKKTISFLEKNKVDYFVLGGLAVGVIGEARFTADLDLDLFISKQEIGVFLNKIQKSKFKVDISEALKTVQTFGSFRFYVASLQVDVILASSPLESSALKRKKRLILFGKKMSFPSPEDLILLKLIPGRPKDLLDVESILIRHQGKLDLKYIRQWIQKICDEAEDFRISHQFDSLIK